jgi:hypothetical protein
MKTSPRPALPDLAQDALSGKLKRIVGNGRGGAALSARPDRSIVAPASERIL